MFERFQRIVRVASQFTEEPLRDVTSEHPFSERSIHERLPPKVRRLFDDTHYAESTFEAFKFLDRTIALLSGIQESGQKLMMSALSPNGPIKLNELETETDKDEQRGFQFMLAGSMAALRNPRGHEFGQIDQAETCLDHLSLVSLFLRRLEDAGLLIE